MSALPDWSYSDIEEMLNYIDPSCVRDDWVRIGMSIYDYFGPDGLNLFLDWSSKGSNYNRKDAVATYNSFSRHGGISIGSLVKAAKENGWTFSKERTQPTEEELKLRAEWRLKREAQIKQQQEAKMAEQSQKAVKAGELIARLPALAEHHYLDYKQVKAYSLKDYNGSVCMPIYDIKNDKVISYQTITETVTPDGDTGFEKRMMRGARKKGGYFCIPSGTLRCSDFFYVAEGYATAATIHEVTEKPVVVCMDCGNLNSVVAGINQRFPGVKITVCADNDWSNKDNPGLKEAQKVQKIFHTSVTYPEFTDAQIEKFKSKGITPSDFNDLRSVLDYSDEQIKTIIDSAVSVTNATETTSGVDYFTALPYVDEKTGKPLDTIENLEEILRRENIKIQYNVITKSMVNPDPNFKYSKANRENAIEAFIKSECAKFRMPVGSIHQYLINIADKNRVNPVLDWITSKPWDGKDWINDLFETMIVKPEDVFYFKDREGNVKILHKTLVYRWLIATAAAAYEGENGISAQGILLLIGKQNIGKTRWVKSLVGPLEEGIDKSEWVKEGVYLSDHDKDTIKASLSCWICELGEIDNTFRKSDVAWMKAFISKQKDEIRLPYAPNASLYPRQTTYVGTVNNESCTKDETGNRRYWAQKYEKLNADHNINTQQLWAQCLELYKKGEQYWLLPEEMDALNESNKRYMQEDSIYDAVSSAPWNENLIWYWMTVSDFLRIYGNESATQSQLNKASVFIKQFNNGMAKRSHGKRLIACPLPKNYSSSYKFQPVDNNKTFKGNF
jgi:putative DNA primase/helicase